MAMSCRTILLSLQQPIEALYRTPEEMKEAVRETVIHEVAHYFGLDDERIDELMEP